MVKLSHLEFNGRYAKAEFELTSLPEFERLIQMCKSFESGHDYSPAISVSSDELAEPVKPVKPAVPSKPVLKKHSLRGRPPKLPDTKNLDKLDYVRMRDCFIKANEQPDKLVSYHQLSAILREMPMCFVNYVELVNAIRYASGFKEHFEEKIGFNVDIVDGVRGKTIAIVGKVKP